LCPSVQADDAQTNIAGPAFVAKVDAHGFVKKLDEKSMLLLEEWLRQSNSEYLSLLLERDD